MIYMYMIYMYMIYMYMCVYDNCFIEKNTFIILILALKWNRKKRQIDCVF